MVGRRALCDRRSWVSLCHVRRNRCRHLVSVVDFWIIATWTAIQLTLRGLDAEPITSSDGTSTGYTIDGQSVLVAEAITELEMLQVSLTEALSLADIISLHVPLTPQTQGMIGPNEIALMRPNALLINTCRGPVIDENALVEALRENAILGAGIDVFATEPLPANHPLCTLHNVLLTPHSAGITRDTWIRRAQFAFANLQRALANKRPHSQIGFYP